MNEELLSAPKGNSDWRLLGMQFYQDEILQFWGEKKINEQLRSTWDVYLYRENGSKEFLFDGRGL